MLHPLSDVQSLTIGNNTNIWQFCVVLPEAKIGDDCNICSHCFIENEVSIGNRVTIKCGVQIWDGITIEDDVFIGPNVTFCNDRYPKSRNKDWKMEKIVVKKNAAIGGGEYNFTWCNYWSGGNDWRGNGCNKICSRLCGSCW